MEPSTAAVAVTAPASPKAGATAAYQVRPVPRP